MMVCNIRALVLATLPYLLSAAPIHDLRALGGIRIPLAKRLIAADSDYSNIHLARIVKHEVNGSEASASTLATKRSIKMTGVVKLQPYHAHSWHGPVTIGQQPLRLGFNTGSSDIIVRGPGCGSGPFYDPAQSSTREASGRTFETNYADEGSVRGHVYRDIVTIAGLTIKDQAIGVADSMCYFNDDTAGFVGMAHKPGSDIRQPSFIQNLVAQRKIAEPIFSFRYAPPGCLSELALGFADQEWYVNPVTINIPVNSEDYWQIPMDKATVNGEEGIGSVNAIIDTGTDLIVGDRDSIWKLHTKITEFKMVTLPDGQERFTFPCEEVPLVSLVFGGHSFKISPKLLNRGSLEGSESDECISSLTPLPVIPPGTLIIGGVFLENVYTIFNANPANLSIRFAELSEAALQCATPTSA